MLEAIRASGADRSRNIAWVIIGLSFFQILLDLLVVFVTTTHSHEWFPVGLRALSVGESSFGDPRLFVNVAVNGRFLISMPVRASPVLELRLVGTYRHITWLLMGNNDSYHNHVVVHPDYQATWLEAVFLSGLNDSDSLIAVSFLGLSMYNILC